MTTTCRCKYLLSLQNAPFKVIQNDSFVTIVDRQLNMTFVGKGFFVSKIQHYPIILRRGQKVKTKGFCVCKSDKQGCSPAEHELR